MCVCVYEKATWARDGRESYNHAREKGEEISLIFCLSSQRRKRKCASVLKSWKKKTSKSFAFPPSRMLLHLFLLFPFIYISCLMNQGCCMLDSLHFLLLHSF